MWSVIRGKAGVAVLVAAWIAAPGAAVQDALQTAVRAHVRALEDSATGSLDAVLARFEAERFSTDYLKRTPLSERRRVLEAVSAAARDAGNFLMRRNGDTFVLTLQGDRTVEVSFTVQPAPPHKIETLVISEARTGAPAMSLSRDNLAETIARLERDGLAGAIHVKFPDASQPFERYFGIANPELGTRVQRDTVFATGSFPIEFTVVAILQLEERGALGLDDRIDKVLPDVPEDKKPMTLRHLLTGRSGLPDFFHAPGDWNADLAWIDRPTAERRILAQPLLFAPGSDRRHSHAAFGLLAAIVERVSRESYVEFVRRNILKPAGMTRTGFNGEALGLKIADFAVGRGVSSHGVPNIPPNWGPTSWLVMGSGGMYSTLPDLLRFHDAVRSSRILGAPRSDRYRGPSASQDGSDHGFELFHAYNPNGGEVFLLINVSGPGDGRRELSAGLARLVGMGGK